MSDRAEDITFKLKNIVTALTDVITEWRGLGTQLDLPEHMLKLVGSSQDVEGRLQMMVSKWLQYDSEASWDKLVNALKSMGKNAIAKKIRSKYVGAVSSQTIPPAPDQDEIKARVPGPADPKTKGTIGSSARDPSNVVPDGGEVLDIATAQTEAKASSSDTKNIWCSSFIDQQLQYQPPAIVPNEAQAAVFLRGVQLWKKPKITVAFTNTTIALLDNWNLGVDTILEWANKWSTLQGHPNHVPEFKEHVSRTRSVRGADIIVELNENGANYTLQCGIAGKANSTDPTMFLDLSDKDESYNQFLVVHEFGHALGLGHEHQRSDFRPCLIPYLDKTKMKQRFKDLGIPEERCKDWDTDVKLDLTRATEYDPKSVMHYWFEKEWLKYGLDDRNNIEVFRNQEIITEKVKNVLLAVHDCHPGALPTQPSAKDLKLVNEEYGKIKPKQ